MRVVRAGPVATPPSLSPAAVVHRHYGDDRTGQGGGQRGQRDRRTRQPEPPVPRRGHRRRALFLLDLVNLGHQALLVELVTARREVARRAGQELPGALVLLGRTLPGRLRVHRFPSCAGRIAWVRSPVICRAGGCLPSSANFFRRRSGFLARQSGSVRTRSFLRARESREATVRAGIPQRLGRGLVVQALSRAERDDLLTLRGTQRREGGEGGREVAPVVDPPCHVLGVVGHRQLGRGGGLGGPPVAPVAPVLVARGVGGDAQQPGPRRNRPRGRPGRAAAMPPGRSRPSRPRPSTSRRSAGRRGCRPRAHTCRRAPRRRSIPRPVPGYAYQCSPL